MALEVAKGELNAPTATGNFSVTGLAFEPKAVLFFATKQGALGFQAGESFAFGMAVAGTARCVCGASDDDVATTNTGRGIRTSAIAIFDDGTPTVGFEATLVSLNSDGFTLDATTAGAGKDYVIHYVALGGSDITDAFIGQQSFSSGTVSITSPGFQPDFIFFLSDNGSSTGGATLSFGVGAAASSSEQGSVYVRSRDAQAASAVAVHQSTSHAAVVIPSSTDTADPVLDLVSFDATGFTYTSSTVSAQFAYLCLKGGQYWVGSETQKTSTGVKSKTGLPFAPEGLLAFGTNRAAGAALDNTQMKLSIGATDGTNEGCIWLSEDDNVSPTDTSIASLASKFLRHASNGQPSALLDDFSGTLAKWSQPLFPGDPSNLAITGGKLSSSSGAADGYYNVANEGPDCFFAVDLSTLPTSASSISLWARIVNENNASIDGYAVSWKATTNGWQISRLDNDAVTSLLTGTLAFSAGDSIAIRCVGDQIQMWHKASGGKWAMLGAATDATYSTAGKFGIKIPDTVARIDNAIGGTIGTLDLFATTDAECNVTLTSDGWDANWTTADATAREFIVVAFGDNGAQTLSAGKVSSGESVHGADISGSGTATLDAGKVASAATVHGSNLAGTGTATLAAGKVVSSAVVRGADLSFGLVLRLGKITSPGTVRGIDLAGTGSVALNAGKVGASATVRGATVRIAMRAEPTNTLSLALEPANDLTLPLESTNTLTLNPE